MGIFSWLRRKVCEAFLGGVEDAMARLETCREDADGVPLLATSVEQPAGRLERHAAAARNGRKGVGT